MKTTNTDLVNILLGSGIKPNVLVDNLLILGKLIKKHGKMLFTEKYIKEVLSVDENLGNLIAILKSTGKISYQDVKNLITVTKRLAENYNPEFNIVSDSNEHNDKLKKHLDTKFQKSKIHTKTLEKIGVSISGEGRYYKKDLDSDLEKILGK